MRKFYTLLLFLLICDMARGGSGPILLPDSDHSSLMRLESDSLMNLGNSLDEDPGRAFLCYSTIVSRYEKGREKDARLAARAANNCGHLLFHRFEQYTEAFSYFHKALGIAEANGVDELLPIVSLNLGNLYLTYANRQSDSKETGMARQFYSRGFDAADKTGNYELMILNFINILSIEMDKERPDTGSREFRRFMTAPIPDTIRGLRYARGLCRTLEDVSAKRYDSALSRLRANLSLVDARYSPERYEYAVYIYMSRIFRMQNKPDSAAIYLDKVLTLSDRYHMPDVRPDALRELSEIHAAAGRADLAADYRARSLAAQDSLLSLGNLDGVGKALYMNSLYETSQQLSDMEARRHVYIYAIVIGSIVLVVILVMLIVLIHHHRQIRNKNRELYLKNRSLLEAEERRRDATALAGGDTAESGMKYSRSTLDDEAKEQIARKIEAAFARPEEFCTPDFTIERLAALIGEKTRNVSQVVNERFGCSFSILLSDSRVKEACRRIDRDPAYARLTVEAISSEMGFSSRTTFLTAFKRVTGLTPSQYRKLADSAK